jgi:biopolymer transport protein ExbB/biopolymer transport protein TolQ
MNLEPRRSDAQEAKTMGLNLVELWGTMGWFAKGIVYVLVLMSMVSLTVAFQRVWDLSRARRETVKFTPKLASALEQQDMAAAQTAVEKHPKSHLASSYKGVFASLRHHVQDGTLTAVEVAAAQRTVELNKLEQIARFRRGMGLLATVGSTAPYVGLLGTTMGVVNAFTGMAEAGSGGLAAISAGIAEALITTALGLFVAIPAVWLYNYFTAKIEFIGMEIDYGGKEFMNFLLVLEARLSGGSPVRSSGVKVGHSGD